MLRAERGDIVAYDVDAIVNAANESLLGGGGVDGAIHRAAGPELLAFCRTLGGCPTGSAKITPGFKLKARHVIHTVGPIWFGGANGEDAALDSCYRAVASCAREHGLRTLALPAISTGVYRFPLDRATRIAVTVMRERLDAGDFASATFVCFGDDALDAYRAALG